MICLVDASNIFFIAFAIFKRMMQEKNNDPEYLIKEDDIGFFWHLLVKKITPYLSSYDNIVFCFEGLHSTAWRKSKYPLYKENRASAKSDENYTNWVPKLIGNFESFLKLFHCKTIRVDNCEADDVIYKLSEYFTSSGEQVNIISSDKDLTQICGFFDGVTVFNPMSSVNKKCVATTTAENYNKNIITEKAIVGDPSDNIKGIPRCGKKTLEKMLADKLEWNKVMNKGDSAKLYETILDIVDLRRFPKEYQSSIIEKFESFDYYNFEPMAVEKFYMEHNLNQCLRGWSSLSGDIQMMLAGNKNVSKSAEDEILELLNS